MFFVNIFPGRFHTFSFSFGPLCESFFGLFLCSSVVPIGWETLACGYGGGGGAPPISIDPASRQLGRKIGERIKNQTRHNEVLSFLGKKRRQTQNFFFSPLGAGEETDLIASNLWVGESH